MRAILGQYFDVTIKTAHEVTGNLVTNSAFAVGPWKTTENLNRNWKEERVSLYLKILGLRPLVLVVRAE
jgi:hypothetical protein